MTKKLAYRGYHAHANFDDEAKIFHGYVVGIRDVITFQASTEAALDKELALSVDDYLEWCEERGEAPDQAGSSQHASVAEHSLV